MGNQIIECKTCNLLPPDLREYMTKTCNLCGSLHCADCLNEAGFCAPCSEKMHETTFIEE